MSYRRHHMYTSKQVREVPAFYNHWSNYQSVMPTASPMSRIPLSNHNHGSNGGHSRTISAPSKLEQLQRNYQDKLLREKEEKLTQMYREREERNKQQIAKYGYRNNVQNNATFDTPKGGGVRRFLQERRTSGVTGKPPIPVQKNSAGRDRGNPLAPINHRSPSGSGGGLRKSEIGVLGGGGSPSLLRHSPKPPPFNKPRLVRTQRRGYGTPTDSGNESSGYDDLNQNSSPTNRAKMYRKPSRVDSYQASSGDEDGGNGGSRRISSFQQWKQKQQEARQRSSGNKTTPMHNGYHSDGASDFQKWQMKQDAERAERLRKHREDNNSNNQDENDFRSRTPSPIGGTYKVKKPSGIKPPLKRQPPRIQTYDSSPDEEQVVVSSRSNVSKVSAAALDRQAQIEAELKQKERELLKMIEQQQSKLEQMKLERQKEEEAEMKQRQEEEAARQRRLSETAGNTSNRSRRASSASRRGSSASRQKTARSPSPAPKSPPVSQIMPQKPAQVRRGAPKKKPSPPKPNPIPPPDEESFYDHSKAADFYLNVANDPDANAGPVDLRPCAMCGRKFAAERLAKHQNVCRSANKAASKRKVFDPVKMRTEGTEMSKYVAEAARKPEPKKANTGDWRKKREDFIKALRYAKKVTEVEKKGGNVADLPPPPPTENAHYVPCPYCERRFAPETAERHIPRCKDIKARPNKPNKPMRKGR